MLRHIFCTGWGRGADKRCRTVRTKVRVRSGGSARHNASQWGWTWLRLATILGQWTRTLRWDNGVQPARDTQIQLFPGSSPMKSIHPPKLQKLLLFSRKKGDKFPPLSFYRIANKGTHIERVSLTVMTMDLKCLNVERGASRIRLTGLG